MDINKFILAKIHSVLVFLLIFLLPTQLGLHFWPHFAFVSGLRIDYYSPTIYLTDTLLILVFFTTVILERSDRISFGKKFFSSFKPFKPFKPFFFFILLFSLYSIKVPEPWLQIYGLTRIIEVFLIFWIISKIKNLKPIFWGLIGGTTYTSILALAQFLNQRAISGKWFFLGERWFISETPGIAQTEFFGRLLLRPYATFSHPNSMAGFLLVSLWLTLYLSFKVQLWRRPRLDLYKLATLLALAACITGIFLSFSQTAWAVLLLTFLIKVRPLRSSLKVLSNKKNKATKSSVPQRSDLFKIIFLFISLSFPLILLAATHFFPSLAQHEEIYLRNFLAKKGIEAFISKPLFGQGINHFIRFLGNDRPDLLKRSFYQPVHNIFWLILAETGLMGLFFTILLSHKVIEKIQSTISNQQLAINNFLSLSFISILLLAATDHYFLTLPQNRLLLGLFLGLLWRKK